ncbi:helix-turn-helix domain-containing protein [Dactylosporangium sp. NPDC005572]|uniref:helix-turn-helix domain-containing protein n=1 Tax=Dactylosporangium sp. NPDC005572 TaxID=3156889 RepID=UPI0033B5B9AB
MFERVRTARLQRCAADLSNPLRRDVPVRKIGARWGFPAPSHFSRLYKAQYLETPQQYRDRYRLRSDGEA